MTDDEGRLLAERELEFARRALGARWTVVGALAGGYQQGAIDVVRDDGIRGVFKLAPADDTVRDVGVKAAAIGRAIAKGWPAAAWITWGEAEDRRWLVQQFAAGEPLESLEDLTTRMVLDAVVCQGQVADLPPFDWSATMVELTRPGARVHQRCVDFGGAARSVAGLVADAHDRIVDAPLPPSVDLVHGDFATDNILEHAGRIAIIDTQSIGRGSRAVDLATMAAHCLAWDQSPERAPEFFEAALAIAGPHAAVFAGGRALMALLVGINDYPGYAETMAQRLLALEELVRP